VAPVQQAERIPIVDILRGFALFGILLVNMALFNHPFETILLPTDPTMPWYDRGAKWLIHFVSDGKFYSLFSFLFGLGLTLLMARIQARGGRFVPLYVRRLLVLLVIGALHAFLSRVDDILIMYALIGFLLIPFRKARPHTLLIWAVILIASPILFTAASTKALTSSFVLGFNVLAMFLIGVWFGKRQVFQNLEANRPRFRTLLIWGLVGGIGGNGVYATLMMALSRFDPSWTLLLATARSVGAPLLCLAYISALALLALTPAWGARLRVLAPVGQMALTNYLMQSVICTLIFYSYGLGLFGQVGPAVGILFAVVIYLVQIPISHWWMKRFRYGPAEWLWRSLTYLKPQPMSMPLPPR